MFAILSRYHKGHSEIIHDFSRLVKLLISTLKQCQVYKCGKITHCPGGLPAKCLGGLIGVPCAECPTGSEVGRMLVGFSLKTPRFFVVGTGHIFLSL